MHKFSLLQFVLTIGGVLGGPMFAVYTMGIFLPIINNKGAFIGSICGTGKFVVSVVHFSPYLSGLGSILLI